MFYLIGDAYKVLYALVFLGLPVVYVLAWMSSRS
jgi:hypothetical protein